MPHFSRRLSSAIHMLFRNETPSSPPACLCRATAEDHAFLRERDALIAEWCRYLPLAEVLDLTLADGASNLTFPDDATLCMQRHPEIPIPRSLVHRTQAWSSQGPLLVEPMFFGFRGRKLEVNDFADLAP